MALNFTISDGNLIDSVAQTLNTFTTRLQDILDSTIEARSDFFPAAPHDLPTPPATPSFHRKKQRKDLAHATDSIRDMSDRVNDMVKKSDRRLMELVCISPSNEHDGIACGRQVEDHEVGGLDEAITAVGERLSNILTSVGTMRSDMDERLAQLSTPKDLEQPTKSDQPRPAVVAGYGQAGAHWDAWWTLGTHSTWQVREIESRLDEDDDFQLAQEDDEDSADYNDWCREDDITMDELVEMTESMLRLD